ncbi:hypothetical protein G6F50_016099 [Rhizopus delemar]|uniref:Uncharacterized protein n=1 Tax=Rhizopus delemar TaxID=936053 RepID=A0A9P6XUF3_9FUNG|nr:hypothetical protein G6F50_016099 [Rhizopus delemar]
MEAFVRQRNRKRRERRRRHEGQFDGMLRAAWQGPRHADKAQPLPRLLWTPVAQQQQSQRQARQEQPHQRLDRHAQARQLALHRQRPEDIGQTILADQRDRRHAHSHQPDARHHVQQHA